MTSSPRAGDGETTLSENAMTISEPVVSGDRTPPSEAELLTALYSARRLVLDSLDDRPRIGGDEIGRSVLTSIAEQLHYLRDNLPALLADRARVDVLSEYLDAISFHFEPGKLEPVVVLDFFVGDGDGHTTVSGDTLREATDVYLEMLARADAGEDSESDAARVPGSTTE